jgi:phosphate:Na+ symporter
MSTDNTMHFSAIVLQLAGAVLLLLYSTRMVRTGFERSAGPALRSLLLSASSHPVRGIFSGIAVATLLQSSTAVVLLVAGFVSTGAITLAGALAIVLGADVGTALVVQFLSQDLHWLVPVLLVVGGILFLRFEARTAKQIGRVILGIAFILLSLRMIGDATLPLRDASQLSGIAQYLSEDVLTAYVGGALLAFLFHSSVAAVLLFATFCAQGVIPLEAGLALVLGANAGGSLVSLWLTRTAPREARRLTLANVLLRTVFGLLTLLLLANSSSATWLPGVSSDQQLINFHLFFNMALLLISIGLINPILAVTQILVGVNKYPSNHSVSTPSALDRNALDHPERALASVTRELLRMSQQAESVMGQIPSLLEQFQPEVIQQIKATEKQINDAHTAIKLYIAELNSGRLSVEEARRGIELTSMAINIERVGDILAKDLLERIEEKHQKRREFSPAGFREISVLHARVMVNLQLSLNVLLSEDLASAKQLVVEKTRIGILERETRARHLHRLMKGTPESIATSDLHLEVVRALKEINSLYTAVAYPILSKSGALLDTRIAYAVEQS